MKRKNSLFPYYHDTPITFRMNILYFIVTKSHININLSDPIKKHATIPIHGSIKLLNPELRVEDHEYGLSVQSVSNSQSANRKACENPKCSDSI